MMTDHSSPDIVERLRNQATWPDSIFARAADEIERLRAVIADAQGTWRPIETAPMDGTPMLGFMPKYFRGKGGQSVILWLDMEWSDMGAHPCDPSHWMPLPEAPAMSSAQRGQS